jgi:hypothetical protein
MTTTTTTACIHSIRIASTLYQKVPKRMQEWVSLRRENVNKKRFPVYQYRSTVPCLLAQTLIPATLLGEMILDPGLGVFQKLAQRLTPLTLN